jgi:hypothetical protein
LLAVAVAASSADVQEAVPPDAKVDKRRLNARLDVDDFALVDIAHVVVAARPLHIELLERPILNDGDPTLF